MKYALCLFGLFLILSVFSCRTPKTREDAVLKSSTHLVDMDALAEKSILLSVQVPGGMISSQTTKYKPQDIQDRLDSFAAYFERILILQSKKFLRKQSKDLVIELQNTRFTSFNSVDSLIVELNQIVKIDLETMLKVDQKRIELFKIWSEWTQQRRRSLCNLKDSFAESKGANGGSYFTLTNNGWRNCVGWKSLNYPSKNLADDSGLFSGISAAQVKLILSVLESNLSREAEQNDVPGLETARALKARGVQSFFVHQTDQDSNLVLFKNSRQTAVIIPEHIGFDGISMIVVARSKEN